MPIDEPMRETIRKGRVFDLTVESITLPNGVHLDLEIIRHPGASAIVPLSADNEVFMLKQYRHAVGGTLWEIPAGTLDADEAPLDCAKRELAEETGLKAESWESMGAVTPVPGYSDERIHLFLARRLTPSVQSLDPDEIIEVHSIPLKKVVEMILSGKIEDAKTIAAIFRALHQVGVGV
jgi:ADP-ribose pyrophosphatase